MIIISFFIFFELIWICVSKMTLEMREETPVNSAIGNILSFINSNHQNSQLHYVSESPFIAVLENGKLVVKKSIDLETLCLKHKLCCGVQTCIINVNILVSNNDKEVIDNVEIGVRIIDKNDHKPIFSSPEQSIFISEFAQIGTSISIIAATDGDATSENRIQTYKLNEKSESFNLDILRLPSIFLRVLKHLNYEDKNRFEADLQACDPETCTSQKLIINIKDENDNQPIFEQEHYNFSAKEDIPIGTSIGQVKANDKDSGKFGEIRYIISVDSDMDLKSTFNIDNSNGKIQLRQKLSTDTRSNYQLRVLARDSDPLHPKQTMCYVTIEIEDVNDHSPIIKVIPSLGSLNISENIPPRYITTIKITDNDQGQNAIVQCKLDPNCERSFELIFNSKNVYSLKTVRQFDHEEEQKIDAIIICKDKGEPSLETIKVIPVYIIDVNEYKPYFKRNGGTDYYTANVMENSQQGKKVLEIRAYDRDKSASLRYQIDNYGSEYFQINSVTGEITCANKELDREKTPSVTFTVHVTDSLIDPKTANVQIKITVLDANDNSPVFSLNLPHFSISENVQATRLVGQLKAQDDDQDENSQITFSLLQTWNGHTMTKQDSLFNVISSGYIETLTALDRERCDYYILEVMASDSARPPHIPLSSKVNVTVKVLDENDNIPIWTYPDLSVYNISDGMRPGDQLFQLKARDIDIGMNGKVRFDIESQYRQDVGALKVRGNSIQYFALNSSTGQLWINQILHSGTIIIKFRASDHGIPVRKSEIKFIINVTGDESSNLNMTIIAVMITVTAVISIFLIVAIICVRRKPPKYHSPTSSILTKDQPVPDWMGLHPSDESIIAYQHGNKSPYITNTLRPASTVPSNDGNLQMHTFTPNCLSYEPVDGDSGDSGKGPSEEGSNPQHQEGSNYYSLRQPIRGTFRQCVPIPASPARSTCHCYVLPEDSIIQPGYSGSFPVYSQSGDTVSIISALPTGYNSYNSLSLPRNQYPLSRQRMNQNNSNKFQQYNPNEMNMNINSNQINIGNNNAGDYPTPRIYSRLTPMHVRRVTERDLESCASLPDDRTSSLVTSTTSATSSTKTVLYNGPPLSTEVSAISAASSPSYADSVET